MFCVDHLPRCDSIYIGRTSISSSVNKGITIDVWKTSNGTSTVTENCEKLWYGDDIFTRRLKVCKAQIHTLYMYMLMCNGFLIWLILLYSLYKLL